MSVVSMKQLLEAGVHFGHQTRRWNPKMKRFIFDERNGIYIIDLQKTMHQLNEVYDEVKRRAQDGQRILFIGTKKQAKESIMEEADRCGMPHVSHRWLGGMLTNFSTIQKRVNYLKDLQKQENEGEFEKRTKKEALNLRRKMEKLDRVLGGIVNMNELPDAVYIVVPKKEYLAVEEARKLGIPIIGIVDTNCDPDVIDYPIPANDDAIKAVRLISSLMANAVLEGRSMAKDVEDAMMAQAALAAQHAEAPAAEEGVAPEAAPAEAAPVEAAAPAVEAPVEEVAPVEEAAVEATVEADAAVVGQV
jgi:small subunit ribosomal protein S2